MSKGDAEKPVESTEVRVTFRTYRRHVEKLERVAVTEDLRAGERPSVGKALNHVIDKYEEPVPKRKKKHRGDE